MRYFFDIVSRQRSTYDYQGRVLPTLQSAHDLAELIALDLSIEPDDEWMGSRVHVRNPEGGDLFSVPVRSTSLAAA